ncbi:hypothetical protein A2Z33_02785 [Candidatus Gottesmanbacteria bacterium RBG_16_52_11]|uniref:Peptidase M23 domain-containing protein n=1 Tax=Candidatus Gottesmanbacteria bacterium RBG_16_52_11 TaxID=1798374 RepID=A0A1F5YMR6_9BACT|nr:MAG: hypothetical protein A2Z33_02785 [Candidatus Gottesmanbacteria bacterium RBG_16_52_11]
MKKIIFLIFAACLVTFFPGKSLAQENKDADQRINELKSKIVELQGKENSLSREIGVVNTKIQLLSLNIEAKKSAINKLIIEAEQLTTEIERLEVLLNKRLELWLKRIPEAYKRHSLPQFGMLLFSQNFQEFLLRAKYLAAVQSEDMSVLRQLKATQSNFEERKKLREDKKVELEKLKAQLEIDVTEQEKQKRMKQGLLDQTRNSEATYQKLLAQALAERQALERALVEGVKVGPVKRGEPIALVGNSGYPGCSTGAHLHFEVRRGGVWTDPGGFLSAKSVTDEQNGGSATLGSGGWDWPLEDTIRLTQRYGQTPYSWRYAYSGGVHTGYDMVSTSSTVIKAPADGTLYSSSQACGSSSIIKIKYIEHGDSVSFYLHVQ